MPNKPVNIKLICYLVAGMMETLCIRQGLKGHNHSHQKIFPETLWKLYDGLRRESPLNRDQVNHYTAQLLAEGRRYFAEGEYRLARQAFSSLLAYGPPEHESRIPALRELLPLARAALATHHYMVACMACHDIASYETDPDILRDARNLLAQILGMACASYSKGDDTARWSGELYEITQKSFVWLMAATREDLPVRRTFTFRVLKDTPADVWPFPFMKGCLWVLAGDKDKEFRAHLVRALMKRVQKSSESTSPGVVGSAIDVGTGLLKYVRHDELELWRMSQVLFRLVRRLEDLQPQKAAVYDALVKLMTQGRTYPCIYGPALEDAMRIIQQPDTAVSAYDLSRIFLLTGKRTNEHKLALRIALDRYIGALSKRNLDEAWAYMNRLAPYIRSNHRLYGEYREYARSTQALLREKQQDERMAFERRRKAQSDAELQTLLEGPTPLWRRALRWLGGYYLS